MEQRGVVRHLGDRRASTRPRARSTATRSRRATGSCCSSPTRTRSPRRCRPATPRASSARATSGATTSGSSATRVGAVHAADVDLRGAPRLVAAHARQPAAVATATSREQLGAYVKDLGFTHVELLPVMEHPYSGSWGYQVTGYFAPTARFGDPDDFRAFVDELHQQGIGVILDWVPAHFPRDEWALARFDGTALYEHEDPRRGAHPDWGTLVFNYGRNEVRNFLLSNALYWLKRVPRRRPARRRRRVDALPRLLAQGRRVGAERVRRAREPRRRRVPAADERGRARPRARRRSPRRRSRPRGRASRGPSTSAASASASSGTWAGCTTRSTTSSTIRSTAAIHHHQLTFSLVYAFSENFILPLSHDEVVHGKGSLLDKMPGDRWQKLANLRALYGYMWAHPGKKLLFMGGELGQWREWNAEASLDWHLLEDRDHQGVQSLVRDLNARLPRDAGAVGGRLRADGLPLDRAERRGARTSSPSCASARDEQAAARLRLQLLAGPALRLPARPAARRALARGR